MIDIFLYFCLGFIIILFELSRKKYFIIDHISFFNFFFFLVYSFTPIALLISGNHLISEDMPYGSEYFGMNPFTSFIVLISYILFLLGYSLSLDSKQKYYFEYDTVFKTNKVVKILPFVFGMLFLFLLIYVGEFGGLQQAIEQSRAYRASGLVFHKFGFLSRFFPLNTILLYYLFFKVVLEKKDEHRKLLVFYFILSVIFALVIISMNSSRGFMIFQVLGLYVIFAMYNKKYYLKYMIPALLVAIFIIKFGRPLIGSISDLVTYGFDTFWNSFLQRLQRIDEADHSIISNFTHPIISLEASLARSGIDVELRYFKDILYAFFSLLPNQLLGIKDPVMLMQVNTLVLQGVLKEVILPGILGFFSYQLNAVGVLIGSFMYGVLGGYIYKIFANFYEQVNASIVFIYMLSLSYGYFVFRGSPINWLIGLFMLFFIIGVIFTFSKFNIRQIDRRS